MIFSRRARKDSLAIALVVLITLCAWAYEEDRTTPSSWNTPYGTTGDALFTTASIKAASEGDFPPLLLKGPKRLGAPFIAEWNSWAITEELLIWTAGVAARTIGLFRAITGVMMLSHILGALAFFYASRQFGYARRFSGVFAIFFGLSWYIFSRNLGHLTVAYCWHVPLCWLVICYALSKRGPFKSRRRTIIALLVTVVTGLQNPYFTFVFVQFLIVSALVRASRLKRARAAIPPLILCGVAMAAFFSMQLDTLWYQWSGGTEVPAATRIYTDMELYALKPLDLILPLNWPIPWLQARIIDYQQHRMVPGEHPLSYMGILAGFGCVLLLVSCFRHLVIERRVSATVSNYGLPILWIIALSIVGGLLGLSALLSSVYFLRSANRFSIFIICLSYLYLANLCSAMRRFPSSAWALVILLLFVGMIDLPARRTAVSSAAMNNEWRPVQDFVSMVEQRTGAGANIFVLPVLDFPEGASQLRVGSYAPLQLYVADSSLQFSYGDNRGHFRDTWQRHAEKLPPLKLARMLSAYGFAGIVVFRNAYEDGGEAILGDLQKAGYEVARSHPLLSFVRLQPAAKPNLVLPPSAGISLDRGWEPIEYDASGNPVLLSRGNASIRLNSDAPKETSIYLDATFDSSDVRKLRAACNGVLFFELNLRPGFPYRIESLELPANRCNVIKLTTELGGHPAAYADERHLAFGVRDFSIKGLAKTSEVVEHSVDVAATELDRLSEDTLRSANLFQVKDQVGTLWREFHAAGPGDHLIGMAGVPLRKIELLPKQASFKVVCIVTVLADMQPPRADIFSCHTPDHSGLVLESVGDAGENRFQLSLGDGAQWIAFGAPVSLQPHEPYRLELDVSNNKVSVRIEGRDVNFATTISLSNETALSNKLWTWGNWMLTGRQFAGRIKLVSLNGGDPPGTQIAE